LDPGLSIATHANTTNPYASRQGASKARDLDGRTGQADCFEFGGQHSGSARIETAGRGRSNEEQQNA